MFKCNVIYENKITLPMNILLHLPWHIFKPLYVTVAIQLKRHETAKIQQTWQKEIQIYAYTKHKQKHKQKNLPKET